MVLDPGHVDKQIFVTELIMILKTIIMLTRITALFDQ